MFIIKCSNCNWHIKTKGSKKELEELDLKEIQNNCPTCGKPRKFRCQNCGQLAKMFRVT